MIKAVYAASWLARRRFYSFSHDLYSKCAYWREPVVWGGRRVLSPSFNEMCRLPHALLMAADGKKILARAMIGIIPASGKGFFAMFDAVENAAAVRCLTDEMTRWMRGQGVCEAVGPIAPVPLDLGGGVLCGGFDEAAPLSDAYNFPYYMRCLRECGFREESCSLAYRVDMSRFDKVRYARTAQYLAKRFGYRVRSDLTGSPREFAHAVFKVMGGEIDAEAANRLIGRLNGYVVRELCPVVYAGNVPVGFLLTIGEQGRRARIVSMWVHEKYRRRGVTVMLFDAFASGMEKLHMTQVDASAVNIDNMASRKSVEHAGGVQTGTYRVFKIRFNE